MASDQLNGTPILDEAKKMMEAGQLPDEVSSRFIWAGLVAVFKETRSINDRVKALERTWAFARGVLIFVLGGATTALISAIVNNLVP